jgi:hypothetical protein
MTEAEFAEPLGYRCRATCCRTELLHPISTGLAQCLKLAGLGMASLWLAEKAAYDLWLSQQ